MARRRYVMTPARKAALRKAQLASAKARKQHAGVRHSKAVGKAAARGFISGGPAGAAAGAGTKVASIGAGKVRKRAKKITSPIAKKIPGHIGREQTPRRAGRGVGFGGLKRNTIPYARVNVRGATVGVNAGTIIPGTSKRIVIGGYARVETAKKHTKVEKAIAGRKAKFIPPGSRRSKAVAMARRHRLLPSNPAMRMGIAGSQARLGTSRKGGPTVIIRRGTHKTSQAKSKAGVRRYDRRMSTIAGKKVKKPRPQRRNRK